MGHPALIKHYVKFSLIDVYLLAASRSVLYASVSRLDLVSAVCNKMQAKKRIILGGPLKVLQ